MPQSSRVIVTFWACFCQLETSLATGCWAEAAEATTAARTRTSFFMSTTQGEGFGEHWKVTIRAPDLNGREPRQAVLPGVFTVWRSRRYVARMATVSPYRSLPAE